MQVLGIDAGGTKTVCLLADGDGRVIASARGRGANLQAAGELEVEKVLHEVMEGVLGARPTPPDAICLGIAGVDRPEDRATIDGIMRRIGYRTPLLIVNDALVALVAGAGDGPGLVIVAGTGSICYGRNAAGHAARAGGWGHVLGDEGSGYWIGRRALNAVMRASDGRGPATRLTGQVLAHFAATRVEELVQRVYGGDTQRRAVAGVAALVQSAADEGDPVAADIISDGADELVRAARSVAERLELRGTAFPLVLAGSLFHVVGGLREAVISRVADVAPRSQPRVLDVEPAVGAVHLALARARGDVRVPTYL